MIRRDDTIVIAQPSWLLALLWLGFPAVGVGVGFLAQAIAGWVATLPFAPMQGPFKMLAALPQPHAMIGAMIVGGLAGLVLAFLAHLENLTVTVTADRVRLVRDKVTQEFSRHTIGAVFVDHKELVLLHQNGHELTREKHDLKADRLAAAFRSCFFPWYEADPYEADFRRWVEDTPGIPAAANALLKARARALEKGDKDDVKQLREEVSKLNIVVRDRDKRQFWRRTNAFSDKR